LLLAVATGYACLLRRHGGVEGGQVS
jgi:hypothetical protein